MSRWVAIAVEMALRAFDMPLSDDVADPTAAGEMQTCSPDEHVTLAMGIVLVKLPFVLESIPKILGQEAMLSVVFGAIK